MGDATRRASEGPQDLREIARFFTAVEKVWTALPLSLQDDIRDSYKEEEAVGR